MLMEYCDGITKSTGQENSPQYPKLISCYLNTYFPVELRSDAQVDKGSKIKFR